jgi:PadR family transcriptional regulator, regulatory protein PadR
MLHDAGERRRCCGRREASDQVGKGSGSLIEPAILAALLGSNAHGYDVRKTIVEITGGTVAPDAGGVYRALRRLEGQGFVRSSWRQGEFGPQRREYELTSTGRTLLTHWREHLSQRESTIRALGDAIDARTPSPVAEG